MPKRPPPPPPRRRWHHLIINRTGQRFTWWYEEIDLLEQMGTARYSEGMLFWRFIVLKGHYSVIRGEYSKNKVQYLNPLNPHDALKHHITSLKTDLIFLQPRVLERKCPCNWFTNTWQFSLLFKPLQIIFIHYKSRIEAAIRGLLWMKMTMVNSGLKGLRERTLKVKVFI